jgi:hypothetical protein
MLEQVLPARARGAAARGVAVTVEAQRASSRGRPWSTARPPHAGVALLERAVARALRLGQDSVPAAAVEALVNELAGRAVTDPGRALAILRERVVGHQEALADLARWYAPTAAARAAPRGARAPPVRGGPGGPPRRRQERARARAAGGV